MMVIRSPYGKPERGGDDSTRGPDGLGDFGSLAPWLALVSGRRI